MNRLGAINISIIAGLSLLMPASASAQARIVEDLIGTAIFCGVTQACGQRPAQTPAPSASTPRVRADPVIQQNQTALNYFGFPAGTADGISGNRTRTAISDYQRYMGFPSTGQLNSYEQQLLVDGYHRSLAGVGNAAPYSSLVGTDGARGLLKGMHRENQGLPVNPNAPAPAQPPIINATAPDTGGGMVFGTPSTAPRFGDASMSQDCRLTSARTLAEGRMVDPANMVDAQFALDEQFCGARDYAIARSQQLSSGIEGMTDAVVQAQCASIVEAMEPYISLLGTRSPQAIAADAQAFFRNAGISNDQLILTGEVCLGFGYHTDAPDISLAAAMMLIGAGNGTHGEVFGHHLRKGYGTSIDVASAGDWYNYGLDAYDQGIAPAFLPSQSEQRAMIIRSASRQPQAAGTDPQASNSNLVLPGLSATN